jgi:hypothetical protein
MNVASGDCNSEAKAGIGAPLQILVFIICAALVISHRPDAISNPQFFAEDGTIWFPEAYMSGWLAALFHSRNGYFQTLPRLAASIALLVPFRFAPLVENLIGILVQVAPVNILLSARCRNFAPLWTRALMAVLYLCLPNTRELDVAIEEGMWHLGLLACLLVLACPPPNWRWKAADLSIILLSGLSGPFSVFLLPVAAAYWWFQRARWRLIVSAAITLSAVIQLVSLLSSAEATRSHAILGATPKLFVQLLAGQVYLAAMLGEAGLQIHRSSLVLAAAAIAGSAIVAYCFWTARLEWKLLLAFCMLVFAASLKSPMVSMTVPQWQVLRDASGIRYWFFPMIGFVWALAWCATVGGSGLFRFAGAAGLLLTCAGIIRDWKYLPYTDHHFKASAAKFEAAAPGTMVNIPIFPDGWTMRLVKNSPACHGLLIGSVDQPREGAQLSGSVPVSGWVVGAKPVRLIAIYIDRTWTQSIVPSGLRPDVDSLYPQSPDKHKGWAATVDVSRIAPGPHEIEVRAREAGGCEADIAVIPVEIAAGAAPQTKP